MLMVLKWFMNFYLFFIGALSFIFTRKHLLAMLLSLEFIVLSLFILLVIFLKMMNFEVYLLMYFLVFVVCEGSLGVSILVSLIRTHGDDFLSNFSILQC